MVVMNYILGGSPASRLFANLREDKGYTYGASSTFTGSTFPGVVFATTDVRTEVTEGAMRELIYEFKRIAQEPVSALSVVLRITMSSASGASSGTICESGRSFGSRR